MMKSNYICQPKKYWV